MTLNIASYSEDWRAQLLSTFAHTPFALRCGAREIRCESVEGFWQGLKFPEGSADRDRVFALWGLEAKRAGARAPTDDTIVLCGERVQLGSPEHHALAEKAMRAKLEQNAEVRRALLETAGLVLTHELVDESGVPVPDSRTLPAAVFCAIWTNLRDEAMRDQVC
ncbi:MAG: hypothetical protein E6H91_02565 [Chloroflexi bacterium]|nr:MAG: hypothetical protein E6H91_02565 [Chloroflexota bacterium]